MYHMIHANLSQNKNKVSCLLSLKKDKIECSYLVNYIFI